MTTVGIIFLALLGGALAQSCRDLLPRTTCGAWKPYCNSHSHRDYLKRNCAHTCGFCSTTGGNCRDQSPNCRLWTRSCNLDYVKRMCRQSCNACGGPATQGPPTPMPPSQAPGVCGKPSIAGSRVISGVTATRGSWPWQILMSYNGRPGCGGSLVSPYWVVTAAHCVKGKEFNPSAFTVRFGEHDQNRREGSEEEIRVSRVISHPTFGSRGRMNMDYDIALFKLSRPPKMTKYVSTVCLPDGSRPIPVGTDCYITGWGKIRHPGRMHYVLQQAKMQVVRNDVCHKLNYATTRIPVTQSMVCAGNGGRTRVSGCHGDSGGPFVCKTGPNGAWELHGAVSWGSTTCSSTRSYTVFARITALRSWIDQQMRRY